MGNLEDADLIVLGRISRQLTTSLESIRPEQWVLQTPCADWTLDALVDHVTGGNWFTVEVLRGQSAESALDATMARFSAGSASSDAATASVADQLAAFHEPDVLHKSHAHVIDELTGRQILRLRLHDLIVHAWDIDTTVRSSSRIASALSAWGLAELSDESSITAEHFGLVATETTPGEDAGAAYLRLLGR